jgi:hypothetical protein
LGLGSFFQLNDSNTWIRSSEPESHMIYDGQRKNGDWHQSNN